MLPYKRPKFSPSNVAEQEQTFIRMHNVAMGYKPRDISTISNQTDVAALANATFPVPSSVHSTFQDLLCIRRQAKLDCFEEPSAFCDCYKCVTHWERMNSELDYYEKVYEDKLQAQMLESDSEDDLKPKAVFTVNSSTFTMPNVVSDFKWVAKNVAHFYIGLPAYNGEHPSTPTCSTAVYDLPASSHGKTAAQKLWIKMQQMTPTRLCF